MRKIDIQLLTINFKFYKNSSLVIRCHPGFASSLYLCFSSAISFNYLSPPKYENNVFTEDLILCHRCIILKQIYHIEEQASFQEQAHKTQEIIKRYLRITNRIKQ